ncbi:MAG: ChaN family lipoprotein [Rhodobacterales bacterium]
MRYLLPIAFVVCGPAFAGPLSVEILDQVTAAPVVIIGEVHDNPAHHAVQAALVAHIQPRAIVFEMLTEVQADAVTPQTRADEETLGDALDWADSGWPDFSLYYPIFAAAPAAAIYGAAVPRDAARAAMQAGIAESFGDQAAAFGLTTPLPPAEQAAQEDLQQVAHCNAMPPEMLPVMVDLQRLRDAVLARETLRAVDATGGPVVVITGNGHARRDWGVPAYIAAMRPDLEVVSIGQQEDGGGAPGGFDILLSSPAVDRPDPCEAFRDRG